MATRIPATSRYVLHAGLVGACACLARACTVLLGMGIAVPLANAAPISLESSYRVYDAGQAPYALRTGDVNSDGTDEFVVLGRGNVTVLSIGRDTPWVRPYSVPTALDIALGDLDEDGNVDAALVRDSNELDVLLADRDGIWRPFAGVPTEVTPTAVDIGDLDGDGHLDAVVACFGSKSVLAFRGRGDGTFDAPEVMRLEGFPFAIHLDDLDEDGRLDLAIAKRGEPMQLIVVLRDGPAPFSGQVLPLPATSDPERLLVGDLEGDGRHDLFLFDQDGGDFCVFRNLGGGRFTRSVGNVPSDPATRVAVGDLNADGWIDLARCGSGSTVSIQLNNGYGGFLPAVAYPLSSPASDLVLADATGDGILDVVATHATANLLSVCRGLGDGRIASSGVDIPTASEPVALVATDIDRDGRTDLLVAHADGRCVVTQRNLGGGQFDRIVTPLERRARAITAADLDGDGFEDAAVALDPSWVQVLSGNNDGTFLPHPLTLTGVGPSALQARDLDGDRLIDLGVTCSTSGFVAFLRGLGDGTFHNASSPRYSTGRLPRRAAVGDMNGDGKIDLVVCNDGTDTITLLHGLGDGTFGQPMNLPVVSSPRDLVVHDLNGDHRDDLVIAGWGAGGIRILFGDETELFLQRQELATPTGPALVAVSDVDADGDADLLVANNSTLSVFPAIIPGYFYQRFDRSVGGGITSMAVGDLTGDGWPDVALTRADRVELLRGDGTAQFEPFASIESGAGAADVALVHLNDDAKTDLAVANETAKTLSIHLGAGEGHFEPRIDIALEAKPSRVVARDLDGDGRVDLVVAHSLEGAVTTLLNRPAGLLEIAQRLAVERAPSDIVLADLDEDSRQDLLLVHHLEEGLVTVTHGLDGGQFDSERTLWTGAEPSDLALGDVDADGRLDLVTADHGSGEVSVLLAQPAGGYATRRALDAGAGPRSVALGDVDRDGWLDLLVADADAGVVLVLRGYGDGSFETARTFPAGPSPTALHVVDLNGDRWLDVIVANPPEGTISVLAGLPGGALAQRIGFGVGTMPLAIALADLDRDGVLDVAVANSLSHSLTLLGNRSPLVPVTVEALSAVATMTGVHVAWRLSGEAVAGLAAVGVLRSSGPAGPWTACNLVALPPAREMSFDDPVEVEFEAWYRLVLTQRDGRTVASAAVRATHETSSMAAVVLEPFPLVDDDASVAVRFRVARSTANMHLEVFDVRGRRVRTLLRGPVEAGSRLQNWDRTDDGGTRVARGVYVVQLRAGAARATQKLVLLGR